MTEAEEKTVEISLKNLARIHQRNRELDLKNQIQEQEIIILQDALTKLVLPKRQTSGITNNKEVINNEKEIRTA